MLVFFSCTDKMNDEIRSNDFKYPLLQFSREDLTDLFVFTIDDKETKIRDDGLSIQKCKNPNHKNCWKVIIFLNFMKFILFMYLRSDVQVIEKCNLLYVNAYYF